ncbi:MAG: hypothetical protein JW774_01060 [Candidatus Aureabacteria bacterium]|nr:hypothetical protein [Candidatus Auribacterota bacterium]
MNYDLIGILTYVCGLLLWFPVWQLLIGLNMLTRIKLLNIAFYGTIFVCIINIGLACFAVIPAYDTELTIYAYVEQNATTVAGLALAIAVFVVIEFKEVGLLLKGSYANKFLSLLLWSFLFSVIGCLPLYWMPPIKGWLTALRHIKTIPFTYSLFILAAAIIIFISELKERKIEKDSENH